MNAKNTRPQHHAPMIALGDIYYILFRHKWKIMILAVLGVVASLILPYVWPQAYQSEAKLLIKYVAESSAPTCSAVDGSRTLYVDTAGRNIINTELHIISSLDLAQEVATNVGTAKIIGHEGDAVTAAAMIHADMRVDNPDGSDIIRITYQQKNIEVAQLVMDQVVKTYLERHAKIHQSSGPDDVTNKTEAEERKRKHTDTEARLAEIKSNLDVVS